MTITLDGTSGITSPTYAGTVTAEYSVPVTAFKNRIINGAMGIWQRGTSFTLSSGVTGYAADRFFGWTANTSSTVTQSTDVPSGQGFKYSSKIQRAASNTGVAGQQYVQIIESNNLLDLVGQNISLSFWAKAGANYSATSNTLSVSVPTGTVADQGAASLFSGTWTSPSSAISSSVTLTTSWQKFTLTGTVGANVLEMAINFSQAPTGTAGADDSFYITGVQLEKGSTATSFDYRPYGTELQLCQRYYYLLSASANNLTFFHNIWAYTTTVAIGTIVFPQVLRTSPSLVTSGTASNYRVVLGGTFTNCSAVPTTDQLSPYSMDILYTVASGLTVGQGGSSCANSSTAAILGFNAEL